MKYTIIESGSVYENEELFGYAAWPTIAKTNEGELLIACSAFRTRHICPFGKTVLFRSKDEGKTWSKGTPIIDTPLDDRDGGVCVFGDKVIVTSFNNSVSFQKNRLKEDSEEGRDKLSHAYLGCIKDTDEKAYLGSTYKLSEDNGYTFGKLHILPITSPHGPCVLNDGRLFYIGRAFSSPESNPGMGYHRRNFHETFGRWKGLEDGIYYMTSSDGDNWEEPIELALPSDLWANGRFCCEPHAIQLKSGRILVHIRVEKWGEGGEFSVYQCHSDDNGKTFSECKKVIEKGSPPHLLQLKSGRVLCSYGYRSEPYGERVAYSDDNGETWIDGVVLCENAPNADLGYPSTTELSNGDLLTVYYQWKQGAKNAGIFYTRWRLEK